MKYLVIGSAGRGFTSPEETVEVSENGGFYAHWIFFAFARRRGSPRRTDHHRETSRGPGLRKLVGVGAIAGASQPESALSDRRWHPPSPVPIRTGPARSPLVHCRTH